MFCSRRADIITPRVSQNYPKASKYSIEDLKTYEARHSKQSHFLDFLIVKYFWSDIWLKA